MSKLRWSKLWWGDWENDPALRLCSLAAQGLWMRLLCLAASSRVYGQVLVAGKPPTVADIARIVGGRPDQVRRLLDELEAHQVFARVPLDSQVTVKSPSLVSPDPVQNSIIVSRRMVADYAEHMTKKNAGKQGGNPILKADHDPRPNGGMDKHADKQVLKAEAEEESSTTLTKHSDHPPVPPRQRRGGGRGRAVDNFGGEKREAKCGFVSSAADDIEASDVVRPFPIVPLRKVR
jgi:hypothetical protein